MVHPAVMLYPCDTGWCFGAFLFSIIYAGWCPPVISWFINPMNTIVISTINHSYGSYKPT